jgi:hypothetical protein
VKNSILGCTAVQCGWSSRQFGGTYVSIFTINCLPAVCEDCCEYCGLAVQHGLHKTGTWSRWRIVRNVLS